MVPVLMLFGWDDMLTAAMFMLFAWEENWFFYLIFRFASPSIVASFYCPRELEAGNSAVFKLSILTQCEVKLRVSLKLASSTVDVDLALRASITAFPLGEVPPWACMPDTRFIDVRTTTFGYLIKLFLLETFLTAPWKVAVN
jgi:hypothetical protein